MGHKHILLRLEKAGVQSTVQDLGRVAAASWGVPAGGAADLLALQLANLLLGNPPEAAALEITLGGLRGQFEHTTSFALAGADCEARLDGERLLPNAVYRACKGQQLVLGTPAHGMRTYLALPGGLDVPLLAGSRATLLPAALGGWQGRPLRKGDVLRGLRRDKHCPPCAMALPPRGHILRYLPGPQWGELGSEGQRRWQHTAWQLDQQSNRMGLKLNGAELVMETPLQLRSHAVLLGTVQLPPGGQPIVLLADAQLTGGYPVIAQIIQADLWRLGQLRAGERVQMQLVDEASALAALREQQQWFRRLAQVRASLRPLQPAQSSVE
ncbi:biotin-dependent carboxyltransferase family protein [Chitinibacter tainanensis]|uniref:5-oxoprolinase subunit C family protein n=1 Tax=Chitinibacter tainanensis TaxID=230667 RepID=UPI0003FA5D9D|nr:biotin-dependent carboxyltransferase family protein [Chitinibacter tainanensis]